jgi:gliding motility-associated-like protein
MVYVERSKDIYAPNIFSPNNDGVNDFFNLFGDQQNFARINYLLIYDRWGNNVYRVEDLIPNQLSTGWDGTYRGKDLNPGVFVWYAEVQLNDGTTEIHQGDVMLIK